jgi:predicted metallo-beta-lactamase superfamily hydrolase
MEIDNKVRLLKDKIEQIQHLLKETNLDEVRQWKEETLIILDHLITEESKYYKNFEKLNYRASILVGGDIEGNKQRNLDTCKNNLPKAKASLQAILYGIENKLL